jgi:hypothetical protein
MTLRLATHASILALIVLGVVGAHRGPVLDGKSYRPAAGYVLWAPGPFKRPAVVVPLQFAVESGAITDCEDRAREGWLAVGAAGELGPLQVHVDVHRDEMERNGLDPQDQGDLVKWSVVLWKRDGQSWRQWSCSR